MLLLVSSLMIIGLSLVVMPGNCSPEPFERVYINPSQPSSAVIGTFKSKNLNKIADLKKVVVDCNVLNHPLIFDELVKSSDAEFKSSIVTIKDVELYKSLVLACSKNQLSSKTAPVNVYEESIGVKTGFIVPGTKWCGAGNTAKNYDDLGRSKQIDACCREHDHCNDFIAGGETKYNLTNTSPYTASHCDCDEKFKLCLKRTNNPKSHIIGNMFFNVLKFRCFRYPILTENCLKYSRVYPSRCIKFEPVHAAEKGFEFEMGGY